MRTDENSRANINEDYQGQETIMKKIPYFDLVSDVALDYMHLICLRVMKKVLMLWLGGLPLSIRLPARSVQQIPNMLSTIQSTTPKEFSRRPRSLSEIKYWKATEFQSFLLYSGPVTLKNILNNKAYINFLSLHVAIRILSSSALVKNISDVDYAGQVLKYFVQSFENIYGQAKISHNVHNLLHLTNDVTRFGALDEFSAFRFENYITEIKKLKKSEKPLQQLVNRYKEIETVANKQVSYASHVDELSGVHTNGPVIDDSLSAKQYNIYICNKFYMRCNDSKNDCFLYIMVPL